MDFVEGVWGEFGVDGFGERDEGSGVKGGGNRR